MMMVPSTASTKIPLPKLLIFLILLAFSSTHQCHVDAWLPVTSTRVKNCPPRQSQDTHPPPTFAESGRGETRVRASRWDQATPSTRTSLEDNHHKHPRRRPANESLNSIAAEKKDLEIGFDYSTQFIKRGVLAAGTAMLLTLGDDAMAVTPADNPAGSPVPSTISKQAKGALQIQTSSSSFKSTTLDSKALLQSLLTNRKALTSSWDRMQQAVAQELVSEPAWQALANQVLQIEGDVGNAVTVSPPSDLRAAIQDLTQGQLNVVVNGELVTITVQPQLGDQEDDLTITVRGFKQFRLSPLSSTPMNAPKYGPIRSYFSKYEAFWNWWATPYPPQYLLPDMKATNGDIILTGTAGTVWLTYVAAYGYYQYEREEELAEAAAKQEAMAAKKRQAAQKMKERKEQEEAATVPIKENAEAKADVEPKSAEEGSVEIKEGRRRRMGSRLLFWRKKT